MAEPDQPSSDPIGYRMADPCAKCGAGSATRRDNGMCYGCNAESEHFAKLAKDSESADVPSPPQTITVSASIDRDARAGKRIKEALHATERLRRKAEGKPRLSLVNGEFLMALAEHMERGNKDGRVANDWQDLPSAEALEACKDAMLRHALGVGPEDEAGHMVAVASNAMIRWWHLTRGNNA